MPAKRARTGAAEPSTGAIVTEKHVDATDEEQSSDDEAPEEVSAAAATALAGRRRKAEQQARQAAPAPKRKHARSSSKGGKNASDANAGVDAEVGRGEGSGLVGDELELPSDLLLKVKSGGLQRMEADVLVARGMKEQAEAASATALSAGRRVRNRVGDLPRSDNFQLVVLDEDGGGVGDGASSKPVATENARKFLRDRLGSRKRASYSPLKARKRLGPSPNF